MNLLPNEHVVPRMDRHSSCVLAPKEAMPIPTIKLRTTGRIETQYLDFDPNNPRLIEQGFKRPTDAEIIRVLADNADLSEIVQSIAANGYIDIEPLIVRRDKNR